MRKKTILGKFTTSVEKQMRWLHFRFYLFTHFCGTLAGQLYLQYLQFVQCPLRFNLLELLPYR